MSGLVHAVSRALGLVARVVPFKLRRVLLSGGLVVESRAGSPEDALRHLFVLQDDLDRLIGERATAYGDGVNPKHRLTRYHDFFVDRIAAGSRVLDVGCGVGAVARSIASRVDGVQVVGIDLDQRLLDKAAGDPLPNLRFARVDGTRPNDLGTFDVLVLSNVLEHLNDRPALLRALVANHGPAKVLIRVPLFERDWRLPLRKELGVNHFSDPDHKIEHSVAEFEAEMAEAGLTITEIKLRWGEIWAVTTP